MPYIRDRAFVLKKEPVNEHDRRYVLYGREHGLLTAVARGTSLKTSKQAGHLEPFTEAEIMI
ncbi:MAG: recombination protein O N-terminal domain-containing protein, partial [Patescibacteria group bacterium]